MNDVSAGALLGPACSLADGAGRLVLGHYARAALGDAGAAIEAERASRAFLTERLHRFTPDIPVCPGRTAFGDVPNTRRQYWCVGPLGGGGEFANQTGQFTVDLALIRDGAPVLGVVVAPAWGRSYWGAPGHGAFRADGQAPPVPIRARYTDPARLTVAARRGANESPLSPIILRLYLAGVHVALEQLGSSLTVCRVAEGAADLVSLPSATRECETAAAQAVLVAAGGRVTDLAGVRLTYDKAGLRNPPAVAAGDPELDWTRFVAPSSSCSLPSTCSP